ncbi:hypothetical protein Goklo_000402 [Gossypium klotzschianum]|uniref:Uncharacterized protein n=1 Tax=Gossypium klotzschianum TaxID=34286 RepID=A0A7J8VWW0_9ROSI|nr:hypothetical protein [Gossypium klotzschianum]
MEEGLAVLSITDGEEEGWNVDFGEETRKEGVDLSVVGGRFLDYEVKSLHQGYGGYIRIQVQIDMRNPLIKMKKLILGSKWCLYACFRYEKLSVSGGQSLFEMRGRINSGDLENPDPNREFIEEDCPMEIGEGEKRPRNTRFSFVSSRIDLGKTINRLSLFMILRYRLALQDRAARCNENIMLECLGFEEPSGKTSPSVGAEGD